MLSIIASIPGFLEIALFFLVVRPLLPFVRSKVLPHHHGVHCHDSPYLLLLLPTEIARWLGLSTSLAGYSSSLASTSHLCV